MLDEYRLPVTEMGVVVPKNWFGQAKEVVVRNENGRVNLEPVATQPQMGDVSDLAPVDELSDPVSIWDLGKNPIKLGLTDASVNHDKYIYGDPHRTGE
jgi:hypothetical protein